MSFRKILLPCIWFCCVYADTQFSENGQGYDTGTFREITPSAGPRVASGTGLFITADFIWWHVSEDGLSYAQSGLGGAIINPPLGSVLHPNFNFQPGFKVGLGLSLNHDSWDIFAQYTWLNPPDTKTASDGDPNSSMLAPYWFIFDQTGIPILPLTRLTSASGDWKLLFNVIDVEVGRNFFISQHLTLRPHIGLKGTWQEQTYIVRYQTNPIDMDVHFMRMGQHENFWGIGTRGGLNTTWFLTKKWSVFGDIDLTALWCDFSMKRKDRDRLATEIESQITYNSKNFFTSLKPVLEFSLGVRWETWFNDNDYFVSFQAAYEQQLWWSRNAFIRIFEESAHGDLVFHGATLKGRFDF